MRWALIIVESSVEVCINWSVHSLLPTDELACVCVCFTVFKKLTGDQAVLQMGVYLLANLVGIGLGLYKVNAMGLLPTSQSDWLEFMVIREVSLQYSRWT